MTNPEKLKKQKLDDEGDARVDILINGEDSTKAEKLQENPLKRDISNTEIYHDGFIDLQGEDETTLQIKVNTLLYVHDEVVLMKNFPEKFMFKGYLCEVCDILHHSYNPSECQSIPRNVSMKLFSIVNLMIMTNLENLKKVILTLNFHQQASLILLTVMILPVCMIKIYGIRQFLN